MQNFIELTLGSCEILHGFNSQNEEILVREEHPFAKKLVNVRRILSLSEKMILIEYAFGRVIYWEYQDGYSKVKKELESLLNT